MRFAERTLTEVQLAPRVQVQGALGGAAESFSEEKIPLRASVLPEEGGLSAAHKGAEDHTRLRLLVPAYVRARTGDGVWVEGALYRIADVRRWTAHAELMCEAVV